jgi:hypothetical protein
MVATFPAAYISFYRSNFILYVLVPGMRLYSSLLLGIVGHTPFAQFRTTYTDLELITAAPIFLPALSPQRHHILRRFLQPMPCARDIKCIYLFCMQRFH